MPKRTAIIALFIFVVLHSACDRTPREAAAAPSPSAAVAMPAATRTEEAVLASGPLVVEHQVDVSSQRDGIVAKILAEPGKRVKAGEVLALLDDRQISSDLEAARAKTRSIDADLKNWQAETKVLEADYQRAQKMWDAQLITKEQLDHAKYKAEADQWDAQRVSELLANSRASERSLELELDKTRIRTPFDGIVARRYVRAGQGVAKGDRLFWVTAEAPLRLRFTLPEKFSGRLRKGEELPLTSADAPQTRYTARVIEVSPVVDPASSTIDVMVELVGAPGELRPGMTATVRVDNPQ